jgi:two-component system NarL family sensor kinase
MAVRRALGLTRTNLEEARRSVLDLRAAPLQDRSLAEALSTLVEQAAQKGLQVAFEEAGGHRPLPVRVEVGLFRIAQEALANVVRHAAAGHATLRLLTTPEEIQLTVEDDGQGFDVDRVPGDRYGLVGLNERARLLGGRVELESSPGEGTRVRVFVPLEAKR